MSLLQRGYTNMDPFLAHLFNKIHWPVLLRGLNQVFFGAVTIFLIAVATSYIRVLMQRRRLPPGPFPLPIVGNYLQLPKEKPWIKFEEWSRKYNDPIITIWVGRVPQLYVNDAWTASDLMEKRANIYSSRPKYVMFGDVSGQTGRNQVLLEYNDHWRAQRKIMHVAVGTQAVRAYRDFQGDEARVLLREIVEDNSTFIKSIERYSCSVVSILGWGRRISRKDDYVVKLATEMMEDWTMMQVPGVFWGEAIPELNLLPKWLYALPSTIREVGDAARQYWYAVTKEGAEAKEPNFSKTLIQSQSETGLSDGDISEMTANLIGGGVDTSSGTLLTCILGLCVFPEVQHKAHEELDSVIGQDRSPEWEDIQKLPYCAAVFKEALRWRSVTVLGGLAHAPIKDDVYNGYHLPAGIFIAGNLWAIHRNPRDFPEPDVFKPDRYLEGNRLPYPNARGHNAFGWGRRTCSGQPLAEQGLSLAIVKLLWAFKMEPGLDENGQEVKLDIFNYTNSENTRPRPYLARFTPRSENIKNIIMKEAADAEATLRKWEGASKYTVEQFLGVRGYKPYEIE